jgi:hypothetical protein
MDCRRRSNRFVAIALLLAGIAPSPLATAAAQFDFCAPVVVRPEQRRAVGARCVARFSEAEIAAGAEVLLLGSHTEVAEPVFEHPAGPCDPPERHSRIGREVKRWREKAAPRSITVVHLNRFEIVSDTLAATPGFDARFLVQTDTPWQKVLDFFALDRSPACRERPCRWSDAWGGFEHVNPGRWLRDSIDASGGPGRYQSAVYNLARPSDREDGVYWPTAVHANLGSKAYRAWRIAEAQRAIRDGGYDAVALGQKFSRRLAAEGAWLGTARGRDVAALHAEDEPVTWTAEPKDYGFSEYMQGYLALAAELRAAGVPYAITDYPDFQFLESWDDPKTPDVNEWESIQDVMRKARVVLLARGPRTPYRAYEDFAAELRAAGVQVVPVNHGCGMAPWPPAP